MRDFDVFVDGHQYPKVLARSDFDAAQKIVKQLGLTDATQPHVISVVEWGTNNHKQFELSELL